MRNAENVNAPWLGGWIIGAAAGLVAFGALIAVGKFDYAPAAAIGIVVAFLAGLFLGMPWGIDKPARAPMASPVAAPRAASAAEPVAVPAAAPVVAPVSAAVVAPVAAPVAAPAATPAAAPAAAPEKPAPASFMSAPASPGPERLKAPRGGKADDLKEIEGIGPVMEKLVNEMGFFHFAQIASWSEADVAMVDGEMKTFKGRITRDKWVAQAKIIVNEGLEAFRERAKTNNY